MSAHLHIRNGLLAIIVGAGVAYAFSMIVFLNPNPAALANVDSAGVSARLLGILVAIGTWLRLSRYPKASWALILSALPTALLVGYMFAGGQ